MEPRDVVPDGPCDEQLITEAPAKLQAVVPQLVRVFLPCAIKCFNTDEILGRTGRYAARRTVQEKRGSVRSGV
jgi:hypothetical protein